MPSAPPIRSMRTSSTATGSAARRWTRSTLQQLLARLRTAFKGQVTGLLDAVPATAEVLAHHSFHVFVVYPWVRFLRRDAATALRVMQDCRIRWGTVESVAGEHVVISSRPLQLDDGRLDPRRTADRDGQMEEGRPVAGTRTDTRVRPSPRTGTGCAEPSPTTKRRAGSGNPGHADLVNACSESASVVAGSEHTGGLTGDRS